MGTFSPLYGLMAYWPVKRPSLSISPGSRPARESTMALARALRPASSSSALSGHVRTLRERERVDLVIVLSHLGFPQDVKLASEVTGIDILLSGHTHNRMDEPLLVNGAR